MKNILKHRTLCPTFISVLSDILYITSDILNIIIYYFILFPLTSRPTFWQKTSDMEIKTSDMSGCQTTFRLHCNSLYMVIVVTKSYSISPNTNVTKL